jgi:hypothetical protein
MLEPAVQQDLLAAWAALVHKIVRAARRGRDRARAGRQGRRPSSPEAAPHGCAHPRRACRRRHRRPAGGKCSCWFKLDPKRWGNEMDPVSGSATSARRLVARATSSEKMRPRAVRTSGLVAATPRCSNGRLNTYCRTGTLGEDGVGDVGGDVAHPPRAAARAQAALLAREGHEDVVAADVAVAAHEALREVPAREVALERVRHVARQRRGVRGLGVRDEGGEVLADEAMQQGVLRLAWDILPGLRGERGAAGERRHAARRASGVPRGSSLFSRRSVHAGSGGAMAGGGANPGRRNLDTVRRSAVAR